MNGSYSAAQRRELEALLRAGDPLRCPACGGAVTQQRVERPPGVSYVRRRVLLICGGCGRRTAVDSVGG